MLSPQPPYTLLLALSVACTVSPVAEYAQHSDHVLCSIPQHVRGVAIIMILPIVPFAISFIFSTSKCEIMDNCLAARWGSPDPDPDPVRGEHQQQQRRAGRGRGAGAAGGRHHLQLRRPHPHRPPQGPQPHPRVTCHVSRAGADPRGARSRGLRRGGGQRAGGGVYRVPRDLLRDGRVRGVRAVPRRAPAEVPRRHEGETILPLHNDK